MMSQPLLAGVDVGTTSVKVLLVSQDGAEVAAGRAPTSWEHTDSGVQTMAEALTAAADAALAEALAQRPDDRVVAIGVASMAESGVLTDAHDEPVAPVIAWHDRRDEEDLAALRQQMGQEFSSRTGLPLWTQWSLTKHRWLRAHHGPAAQAARRYNVAEWIVRGWGGERATELSLASRTGWLDLASQQPWSATLEWAGAGAWVFADLAPAGTALGRASTSGPLAAAHGAVLTVAGHDHQVAAVGLGCHRPGDEFDSCGTAEAILRTSRPGLGPDVVAELAADGITVGAHAAPGRWCLLGATEGGRILGTVMDALGMGQDDVSRLDRLADHAQDRPDAVSCGHDGGEVAIDPDATPGEVWRAAVRAVTAQAGGLRDRISQASGAPRSLVVAGGWTHSQAFMRAKRDRNPELKVPKVAEAGCLGAAAFAGLAAGTYHDLDDAPLAHVD